MIDAILLDRFKALRGILPPAAFLTVKGKLTRKGITARVRIIVEAKSFIYDSETSALKFNERNFYHKLRYC
jgi:hypothetical protein